MTTTILGVLILVCAVFLIGAVLLQSSKNHRMSGVVSGGAETFFGKQKGKTIDAALSKATAVISIIFCVLVLALYLVTARANKADNTTTTTPEIVVDEATEDGATVADETTEGGATVVDETAEGGATVVDETAEGGETVSDETANVADTAETTVTEE